MLGAVIIGDPKARGKQSQIVFPNPAACCRRPRYICASYTRRRCSHREMCWMDGSGEVCYELWPHSHHALAARSGIYRDTVKIVSCI